MYTKTSETLLDAVRRRIELEEGPSPYRTVIPGVTLMKAIEEKQTSHLIYKPALCVVVQGAKSALFGDKWVAFGPGRALVVSLEMPAISRITEASPSRPYLAIAIEFDIGIMREVMGTIPAPVQQANRISSGVLVTDFDGPLADCVQRTVNLLDTPAAIPTLFPLIMHEICYWLLTGPHGADVANVALASNHLKSVIRAIHYLRDNFREPIKVEELAELAQTNPSVFHRQFKLVTSMTPLQYQKQLRLMEARRLLHSGISSAETAAYEVGYESATQFSREYNRMFGSPPRRDAVRLQANGAFTPALYSTS